MNQLTEQQFLEDVAKHEITIIQDNGVYRHVKFNQPGTRNRQFDLITWPGYLCYSGDMGTYVFNRLNDMFEFFRTDRDYYHRKGLSLGINPGCWAEKVEGIDKFEGVTEFSEALFKRAVLSDLTQWLRNNRDTTSKDDRRELWDAVMDDVLGVDGDNGGYRQQAAAHDFSYLVGDKQFTFVDFWDHNVTDYTPRFLWCCYAIAWGIQRYDDTKKLARLREQGFQVINQA